MCLFCLKAVKEDNNPVALQQIWIGKDDSSELNWVYNFFPFKQ